MPGEKPVLWKQAWTENQMDIQRRDQESNPGSSVHSTKEVPLSYLLQPNHLFTIACYRSWQNCTLYLKVIIGSKSMIEQRIIHS